MLVFVFNFYDQHKEHFLSTFSIVHSRFERLLYEYPPNDHITLLVYTPNNIFLVREQANTSDLPTMGETLPKISISDHWLLLLTLVI